ncbi:MAG: PulJ/GspJ family protein [Acidimicrobiales bacterium]
MTRLRTLFKQDQSGTTLVELMIALALFSLISGVAYASVNTMVANGATSDQRFAALGQAQIISTQLTKDLRQAVAPNPSDVSSNDPASVPFYSVGDKTIYFYAWVPSSTPSPNGTPPPVLIYAHISNLPGTNVSVFHEDQEQPQAGGSLNNYTYLYGSQATYATRDIGDYVDSTLPIYQYFDSAGRPVVHTDHSAITDANPLQASIPADIPLLDSIYSVQVTITSHITPTSPATTVTNRIFLRNAGYNPAAA